MKLLKISNLVRAAVLSVVGLELVERIDGDDDEIEEYANIIGGKITLKMLKDIEDDWVNSYIIN